MAGADNDGPEPLIRSGAENPNHDDFVRVIMETFPNPFLILTGELNVAAANASFYRTFRVSPQETEGRCICDLGNGQWDIPVLRILLEKILPKETRFENYQVEHEFPLIGKKIMKLSARRFLPNEGLAPMVLLAMEDITELKTIENELRFSEAKYRSLFENARAGIFILDFESRRIDAVNSFLVDLLGFSKEELIGKELHEVGIFKNIEVDKALFNQLEAKGHISYDYLPLKSKAGRHIDAECVCSVYPCEGKRWVQCNIRDITERKRMADALKYSTEKLRQSQRTEAIGKLAGGVAHKFNNLLTSILGYCSLGLNMVEPEGPLHDSLEEIRKAGEQAAELTRQILAYSRQQVLMPKQLNLNAMLSDMFEKLRRQVKERIELDYIPDPALDLVKADKGQMAQVITHLVMNASDAIAEGGRITIETKRVELDEHYAAIHPLVFPGVYAMLAVSDTGVGMDATAKAHAFDPFFTTKDPSMGAGLGLSMVYGIINQSHGHISVYSEPGSGAMIKVYLPAVDAKGKRILLPTTEPADQVDSGHETVLLVEDEDAVRKFAREVLELNGFKVLEAMDGNSALAIMEDHPDPIHLLLTDLFIPGMSGVELSHRFQFNRQDGRILFMSGYTLDAVFHLGILAKDAQFIQKPFTPAALLKAIRGVLALAPIHRIN